MVGARPDQQLAPSVEALTAAVAELDVDVLGMQEVDVHQPRSEHMDQPRLAAESMGADHWRFVPTVRGTPGNRGDFHPADTPTRVAAGLGEPVGPLYGVALVSRLEVTSWHSAIYDAAPIGLPLLVPGSNGKPRFLKVPDEPRAVVAAVVATVDGPVTVATAHLSFVPGYNIAQLRRIRHWLRQFPRPLVLLGDFNLPGRLPERITGFTGIVSQASYPSYGPRVQFDHILVDGLPEAAVADARASAQALSLHVSDHCAILADIPLG